MTIEQHLTDAMKQAMRDKNADLLACIRQVRAKVQEATNADGFSGQVDDALYQTVISAYVRSLEKTFPDLETAGERGQTLINKYRAEIVYLKQFLPQMLDAMQTRALVRQAIAALGVSDPKQVGRITGAIMKENKGKVDPALVRTLIDEELGTAQPPNPGGNNSQGS